MFHAMHLFPENKSVRALFSCEKDIITVQGPNITKVKRTLCLRALYSCTVADVGQCFPGKKVWQFAAGTVGNKSAGTSPAQR